MMVVVTGASGSGKSEYAEGVAVKLAGKGVKQEAYHFKVNPPHTTLDLELLKERTTKTRIGRYKNKKMTAR